ncbi:hypothetical protein Tco_0446898 [Tanacetum coccineum]
MINKINILWKVFSEKLYDTSTRDTAGDSMAHVNATSTDQIKKEELRSKGINSPSKLLSPKYLSQTSLEEQNRNPSSPKRVHFINFVVILRKEDKVRKEENVKPNATEYNDHDMTAKAEEKVEEESKDEFKEEIEEEEEEEEEDVEYFDSFPSLEELRYHEWLLKYPKPSWVNAKIRTRRRVRSLKVIVSHFTYECDFIILEDTTSIIDHDMGVVVFGNPFVERTELIYDKKEGTVAFEDNNERLIFKMPHKMEMFKNVDFMGVNTDRIPSFIIGGNDDDNEKTHYSDSLNLGSKYKYDESVIKIVLWYLDSKCSKHIIGNRSQLTNFVNKFLGRVKFGNDQIAKIMGYGDYQIRNVTISEVYYVEGLGYNLFFVGQFCDSDLEVAFCKHTCFVRNLEGVDLLTGSRGTNLYTLSIGDMMKSSPICLLSKASKTESWLWKVWRIKEIVRRTTNLTVFDLKVSAAHKWQVRRTFGTLSLIVDLLMNDVFFNV